jgi:cytochrome c oxidase subunit 2
MNSFNHHALHPAGPLAHDIAAFFWVITGVTALVYLVVMGFLLYALRRRTTGIVGDGAMPRVLRNIGIGVGITAVVLVGFAVNDFIANRSLNADQPNPIRVKVTAHQWWWEVEYVDSQPSLRVTTANELALPVDRPVMLQMTSSDVIHSFWVPNLNGKRDLLPGYTTRLALIAAQAGAYVGECAEFCGFQHAHMSIDIAAKSPQEFAHWLEAQRSAAVEPSSDTQRHKRDVFLSKSCRLCHAIMGTEANARLGPDLTHLASRARIAAGARPNDAANLAAWIADPQGVKPGTRMPATPLSGTDLNALVAYLGSLR